ncbi:MAG TPA: methyltransferase domain-containing protein [Acidimicrobiia bacterium]|nr:methyltransferase domain-containing protein [Acidimicrobiia bacterium]
MTSMVSIITTSALERALLDAAGVQPGARVLDVGCGIGDTTLDAARRVGPSGLALGVDDSLTMLEQARQRAADAGLAHVGFVHADAQTQRFAPLRFDVIVSGRAHHVFTDPDAGFTNLARALRPGGRLAVLSREEPDRAHAVLTRAGLVDVSHVAVDADAAPVWLVRARGRD